MPEQSNMMVIKQYFGYKVSNDGTGTPQTLQEFAAEVKCLSEEEKVQLATGIKDGTFNY